MSFHVGSQTTNFENYVQALNLAANVFKEAKTAATPDEGAGYRRRVPGAVRRLGETVRRTGAEGQPEFNRLFPNNIEILAEPGRFIVATGGIAGLGIIGKAVRDGKLCYYIDDGVYHTFSGIIFDHCHYHMKAFKSGPPQICSVFGPTCDALDMVSMAEELPAHWNWAICSIATTSAPAAKLSPPISTASHPPKSFTSTGNAPPTLHRSMMRRT